MPFAYQPSDRTRGAAGLFDVQEYARRRAFSTTHGETTPLVRLPGLARALGVGGIWVKNETTRFGLPAFKSLGVEYALHELAARGDLRGVTTLICASAGNHGRAVARAARVAGLSARIFLDAGVADVRMAAIASEGAEVVRVAGTYDHAVRLAAENARAGGGLVVSDTSWAGYEQIPHDIMLGYTCLMDEAEAAWGDDGPPEAMIVQAGVGGLLAAVASWSAWRYGDRRPALIAVEPALAACVQASAREGSPTPVEGPLTTIMAGLRCGEMSPLAYPAIRHLVDGYVAVEDSWTRDAMRALARPVAGDPAMAVGTSGAAGLAALLALCRAESLRDTAAFGIGSGTRVLIIATEGVTEPELWKDIVNDTGPGTRVPG